MAKRKAKTGRGGWRPRAGRKPELSDPLGFNLDLEGGDLRELREIAEEEGVSVASIVRKAIKAHLARRRR